MSLKSTLTGRAVPTFPDVGKTPAPSGPVPIPYPNIALSKQNPVNTRQLRGQIQSLHVQIMGMPGGNPNRWHELLDRYVILTAQLYSALATE
jgi:hypothetical protein